jgi:hypothetical protein
MFSNFLWFKFKTKVILMINLELLTINVKISIIYILKFRQDLSGESNLTYTNKHFI